MSKATKTSKKPAAAAKAGDADERDEYDEAADAALLTPEVRLARLERVVAGLCGGQDRFDSAAADPKSESAD